MRQFCSAAARWLAVAMLALAATEACTSSSTGGTNDFNGPPVLDIEQPASALSCDNVLVVTLDVQRFYLRPPNYCGTTEQCGTVRVSLLETDGGPALVSTQVATAAVQLDLSALVNPSSADAPTLSQVHFVKAELYDDSLNPVTATAGGQTSAQISVSLTAATDCSNAGSAGAAGASDGSGAPGAAGATGDSSSEAGAGGALGSGGASSSAQAGAGG